ncbi:MAG: hypothetical protein COA97_02930 [Flavobacteriales bacterium]|nr:MAG: hypothetical protein COA97_02930 [Flavobacteriales bacterium]
MIELNPVSIESSELIEETFKFWFNDNDHIRTPFPEYIRHDLQEKSIARFFDWASNLHSKAKDEVTEEIIAEKFEEFIFETATRLVITEDEKLTIEYPFLPRLGDVIFEDVENKTGESTVVDRSKLVEEDTPFMVVVLEKIDSNEKWETKFQLPK